MTSQIFQYGIHIDLIELHKRMCFVVAVVCKSKNSHVSNTTYLWTGLCLALFYFIYDVKE